VGQNQGVSQFFKTAPPSFFQILFFPPPPPLIATTTTTTTTTMAPAATTTGYGAKVWLYPIKPAFALSPTGISIHNHRGTLDSFIVFS